MITGFEGLRSYYLAPARAWKLEVDISLVEGLANPYIQRAFFSLYATRYKLVCDSGTSAKRNCAVLLFPDSYRDRICADEQDMSCLES